MARTDIIGRVTMVCGSKSGTDGGSIVLNSSYPVVITPLDGYKIDSVEIFVNSYDGGVTKNPPITNPLRVELDVLEYYDDSIGIMGDFETTVITSEYIAEPEEPPKITITVKGENVTVTDGDIIVTNTGTITTNKDLLLEIPNNFEWVNVYLSGYDSQQGGDFREKQYQSETNQITIPYDDFKIMGNWDLEIETKETGQPVIPDTPTEYGFTRIFKVNQDILEAIGGKRVNQDITSTVNYNDFIYNLYILPTKISNELISTSEDNIKLGGYDTEVKSKYILTNKLIFDLGTITTPLIYNNVYDFKDTTTMLHVPYTQPFSIDNEYVIGETIKITLTIDLYNGFSTVNIFSSKIDNEMIEQKEVDIIHKIPFVQYSNDRTTSDIGNYVFNNVTKPFIEVIRNIPYNVDTQFGKPSIDYGKLIDYVGYIEVDNIELNTLATNNEKNDINRLLQNGIVIK